MTVVTSLTKTGGPEHAVEIRGPLTGRFESLCKGGLENYSGLPKVTAL